MGSAILIQISRPGAFPVDPFFALIGLTYAVSVFYLATLRFAEGHLWLVDLQFGVDALLVSAFIHVTGGITSNFSSLYLLPIIAASMIRYRRVAVQLAALSAIMYLALVAVQYVDVALPLARRFSPAVELPTHSGGPVHSGDQPGWLHRRRTAGRIAGRQPAFRGRTARGRLASIRDLRAFNEYVINSLLSGLMTTDDQRQHPDLQSRRVHDHWRARFPGHRAERRGSDADVRVGQVTPDGVDRRPESESRLLSTGPPAGVSSTSG